MNDNYGKWDREFKSEFGDTLEFFTEPTESSLFIGYRSDGNSYSNIYNPTLDQLKEIKNYLDKWISKQEVLKN